VVNNKLLINYCKKEEIKKAKERQQEGYTRDEIINLANKDFISEEELNENLFWDESVDKKVEDDLEITEDEVIINDEEIIGKDENNIEKIKNEEIIMISDSDLEDYPNQPFKLYDNTKKTEMMESIKLNGIMQPLIVRKIENGKFQILSGHNRRNCARELGINKLPCIVKELNDDEAMLYLVDTNLCTRENISTMEKAKAYKIKYDTYKNKKINVSIIDEIKKDNIDVRTQLIKEEKTSNGNIQRYLRLTYLIPKLQHMIDNNKLSINLGEKISFLPINEQKILGEILATRKIKLSEKIVKDIRKHLKQSVNNVMSKEEILNIVKVNKQENEKSIKVIFYKDEIEKYFANCKSESDIKTYIFETLKAR